MADLWLPNAERHIFPAKKGGVFDRESPVKVVLHTTEGSTIQAAINAYARYPPHMVVSFNQKKLVQHIPLNKASYSLSGSESDDEPCIQVEIVGFASASPTWSEAHLRWLAVYVLAQIYKLKKFELRGPPQGFHGADEGIYPYIASASSPIRFKKPEFEKWGGVCGHQHIPAPDHHWDPGRLNIGLLLNYTKEALVADSELDLIVRKLAEFVNKVDGRVNIHEARIKLLTDLLPVSNSPFDMITALYRLVLDREPDDEGLDYWTNQMNNGMSFSHVVDGFLYAKALEKQV